MTAAPDKSLERYEIIDRIAVGGMAEVFRAKAFGAHGFEKSLAIKRILPDFANDPEFEERFIQEAKLAVQLAHANIVQVFDFGRFDGTLFIAMEYVEGLDLAALLRVLKDRDEHVAIGAALHMCAELCKGLDYAHQRGVVHRDVSPSNVLLSRSGEVKIADFGIAQAELDTVAQRPQRRIMGKWRYMSPEQAMGAQLVAASDLFSAGAVMHEVFTGQKLFPGDEAEQVLDNIRSMPIPKVTDLRPQLPHRLNELLGTLLERDVDARPARAAEIQRALTEVSYESSIVASALDVADTVGSVIGEVQAELVSASGAKRGIDDLIRQQIGAGKLAGKKLGAQPTQLDMDRHTEQASMLHTQTFVKKGTDVDGSTMWEIEGKTRTLAASPPAIRGERSGRVTGRTPSMDRETPDLEDAAVAAGIGRRFAVFAAVLVVGGGVAFFALREGGGDAAIALASTDAGASSFAAVSDAGPRRGFLNIRSVPAGARVRLNGALLDDVTPVKVAVQAMEVYTVVLEHDDYRTKQIPNLTVMVDETFGIRPELEPKAATLIVKTKPPGADVFLNGDLIGKTPLTKDDIKPFYGMELVIKKLDHRTVTRRLDLDDGKTAERFAQLVSTIEYGKVKIAVSGATNWANVYYKNKLLGRTPAKRVFDIPVGKRKIRLENPAAGIKKMVNLTVFKDHVELYTFEL